MKRALKASLIILTVALTSIHSRAVGLGVEPVKDGTIVQIANDDQLVYGAHVVGHPIFPMLGFNNAGQVAFLDVLSSTSDGRSSSRIAVGSPESLTEIARTGQPTPDRNGSFSARSAYTSFADPLYSTFSGPGFQSFDNKCGVGFLQGRSPNDPRMAFPNPFNGKGQVAFLDELIGTSGGEDDNIGIFLGGAGIIRQIARSGQSTPDRSGVFSGFSLPVVNDNGDVAFEASILDSGGRLNCTTGIFLARKGMLTQVARSSRAATLDTKKFVGFKPPVINNKGQVAFVGYLSGFITLGQPNGALYLADDSTLVEIARVGQTVPDSNGKFADFSNPAINDQGQVAFQSILTETKEMGRDNNGIFLATVGKVVQIARAGQPAPDGNGTVLDFSTPLLNNAGQVAFGVTYTGSTRARIQDTAIFRSTPGSELRLIVRAGFPAADGNGRFSAVGHPRQSINDKGQVVFDVSFIETREPGKDNTGIYLGDGETLVEVVRSGQLAPGERSKFAAIGPSLINDSGQIAFGAQLTDTRDTRVRSPGIYIWSPGQKR